MSGTTRKWIGKRWEFIGLLVVVGLLAGQLEAKAADSQNQPSAQYTVAFAQDTLANDWRVAQVRDLEKQFQSHPNIHFIYTDGDGSTAKQIQDIEDLIYRKVDVLITSPRDGLASTPVISRAYRQGIPVVLITRSIASEDFTALVSPDDTAIAAQAATYMAEKMHAKGKVLILRGVPTASTAKARTQGFLESMEKFPGIEIVAIKNANYLRADAIQAVEEVLAEGQHFDAIYAQSDSMASGARLALKKSGIDPRSKLIVGIDYISEAREAIRSGEQSASFVYPTCSKEVAAVVMKILKGEKVPKRITVPSRLIDRSNVEKYVPIF